MSKKRDTLTGGTGDVNPQWLKSPVISNNTIGTYAEAQVPLPVQRLQNKGRAMVMELLKVAWNLDLNIVNGDALSNQGTARLDYERPHPAR